MNQGFAKLIVSMAVFVATPGVSAEGVSPGDRPCFDLVTYLESYELVEQDFYAYTRHLKFPPLVPPIRFYSDIGPDRKEVYPLAKLRELPDGFFIFVLSHAGQLATSQGEMTEDGIDAPAGHRLLARMIKLEEKDVATAGEFLVVQGKIRWIGNRSGTFKPPFRTLDALLNFFNKINMAEVIAEAFYYEETPEGPQQRPRL